MGITIASARFLLQAYKSGVRFGRTITLGRQDMTISTERLETMVREHDCWPNGYPRSRFRETMEETSSKFETFLKLLGANSVVSCDISDYEGATICHDLNLPVPASFHDQFDVVIDGGTLEHIFHFPVAITSCMRMLKPGGHLILFTPANNYFGHGFYQFSPELFYRVLCPQNGFAVERMVALGDSGGVSSILGLKYWFPITSPWYDVRDPDEVKDRVTLISDFPVSLFVQAQKVANCDILAAHPQQSDYVRQWTNQVRCTSTDEEQNTSRLIGWLRRRLPAAVRYQLLPRLAQIIDPLRDRAWLRKHSLRNDRYFSPVEDLRTE